MIVGTAAAKSSGSATVSAHLGLLAVVIWAATSQLSSRCPISEDYRTWSTCDPRRACGLFSSGLRLELRVVMSGIAPLSSMLK